CTLGHRVRSRSRTPCLRHRRTSDGQISGSRNAAQRRAYGGGNPADRNEPPLNPKQHCKGKNLPNSDASAISAIASTSTATQAKCTASQLVAAYVTPWAPEIIPTA